MSKRAAELIKRWERLKGRRSQWLSHWDDIARVTLPRRLGFLSQTIEGDKRTQDLFDGTAIHSAKSLANVTGSLLRPEGRPWVFIKTVDDSDQTTDEAKDWLADAQFRLHNAIYRPTARFRQATGEIDLDLVTLGTAIGFVGENDIRDRLTFRSISIKDALPMYAEDGNLEGIFLTRSLPLRSVIDRPGWRLSEELRKRAEDRSKIDEKVKFLFAIVPRRDGRDGALINRNLPIAELVIEIDTKHEVAEGGYHEMPYFAPRWDTSSGEDYGRSPGMTALPDANSAQAIGETMLVAGQRAADPPILAPSDSFMDTPNTSPGGIAYYEADAVLDLGGAAIRPLEPGRGFPLTREIQNDMREQIRNGFMQNVFDLPIDRPQMTATEVVQRTEKLLREIGPVFGRLESDYTAPMVERAFQIILRSGGFLPIPPVLQGAGIRFEYESPVKRMRERAQAVAAIEWAQTMATVESIRPGTFDRVDTDALAKFVAEAMTVPRTVLRSDKEVAQIRDQRAQAQAAAAKAAELQQMVEGAKTGTAAIKNLAAAGAGAPGSPPR